MVGFDRKTSLITSVVLLGWISTHKLTSSSTKLWADIRSVEKHRTEVNGNARHMLHNSIRMNRAIQRDVTDATDFRYLLSLATGAAELMNVLSWLK